MRDFIEDRMLEEYFVPLRRCQRLTSTFNLESLVKIKIIPRSYWRWIHQQNLEDLVDSYNHVLQLILDEVSQHPLSFFQWWPSNQSSQLIDCQLHPHLFIFVSFDLLDCSKTSSDRWNDEKRLKKIKEIGSRLFLPKFDPFHQGYLILKLVSSSSPSSRWSGKFYIQILLKDQMQRSSSSTKDQSTNQGVLCTSQWLFQSQQQFHEQRCLRRVSMVTTDWVVSWFIAQNRVIWESTRLVVDEMSWDWFDV